MSVIYFLVTSNCNLACKYCFLEKEDKNKCDKNMSMDIAKIAIEKYICYLKKYDIKKSTIIFYGGEPLINWKVVKAIIERVNLEKNIKFTCTIVTNGTLLTEEINNFLLKYKVNIGISIDGPKEINDKNRIFKFSDDSVYDKIINVIENEKNLQQICLSMTLSPDILKNKDEIFKWLKKIGVKFIGYNLYCPTKNELNWEKYGEDSSDFLIESFKTLNNQLLDDRIERKIESLTKREFKFTDCGAMGGNQVVIKADGDICICHGYEKINRYTIGNINNIDYDDVLNSEEINFWKKRLPIYTEECLKCEALFCCGGGCPNRAEILFGDRKSIDKVFCIHTKRILYWYLENIFEED
ncbi:MAG: radical SAM protein [Longibaculum sp.]